MKIILLEQAKRMSVRPLPGSGPSMMEISMVDRQARLGGST
ncbi:MAG: hypothetical protein OXF60_07645 [Gammaproteobacteria bacterium]|nr:hypothetical protein [Gammaproteobacteria bacterium]